MLNFVEIGRISVVLRERKGLTQEKLALEAEMSVIYLRRIERGRANPTLRALDRVRPYWDWSSPHFCSSPKEDRNLGKNRGRSAMERHRHTPDGGGTV